MVVAYVLEQIVQRLTTEDIRLLNVRRGKRKPQRAVAAEAFPAGRRAAAPFVVEVPRIKLVVGFRPALEDAIALVGRCHAHILQIARTAVLLLPEFGH